MCDRPPACKRPATARISGTLLKEQNRTNRRPREQNLFGGSTAKCHVVRGYRYHRPSVSGNGCPAIRIGACPGTEKPVGNCRAADGYVNAQTTLRICTCDCQWIRRPTALLDTTLK